MCYKLETFVENGGKLGYNIKVLLYISVIGTFAERSFAMADIKGKRILMTLTRFDIGGAETHVLELSLELQRMGFYVVVASNGGVYEENLKEAGIPHYKVPMHSKSPSNMSKSLKELKRIIKDEKIDLVHAHGRIPAFLCGILKKTMDFTFVTTAHWVFDTSHGLKYLSNWGQKVMAVSEDIKTYLMDNYKTNPVDIYVTINGIDTEKFKKSADTKDVISEFSLNPESKKIVYISRMDSDRARLAFELAEIAPEIEKLCPGIEIVIVGGGNVYDELCDKCDEINKKIGKRTIILTGGRTDIYKFAALGDIFVGVSRSALEAMSCEKPVIVAGNEGYLGIFDEDKLAPAVETNFCCRGLCESSCERLLSDIKTLLTNEKEENERLGKFGRDLIKKSYSLSKMAGDCVKMYTVACDNKKWDAVISGYYGYKNSGDESLLYAMIENLKSLKDDVRLLVLSKDPKETFSTYGVNSINRFNVFKIRKEMKRSKLFIFGGGSLLQDVTSNKSLWYYLTIIKQALSLKLPVMIYANGIGPVNKESNKKKVKNVLDKVETISLRDLNSYYEIKRMGIDMEKVTLTADPALTIKPIDKTETDKILEQEGISPDKKFLGISIRSWGECKPSYWNQLAGGIEQVCRQYELTPLFIPLKYPDDLAISKEIASKIGVESAFLTKTYSAPEIVGIVGNCEMMVAMRLHSLVYASSTGVPAIGLSYDPKVSGFVKYIGVNTTMGIEGFKAEDFALRAREIMLNKDEIKTALKEKTDELKEKAFENAKLAMKFIKD